MDGEVEYSNTKYCTIIGKLNYFENLLGYVAKSTELHLHFKHNTNNELNIWVVADWGGLELTECEIQDCTLTTGIPLALVIHTLNFVPVSKNTLLVLLLM
jgi:hypothetical protein